MLILRCHRANGSGHNARTACEALCRTLLAADDGAVIAPLVTLLHHDCWFVQQVNAPQEGAASKAVRRVAECVCLHVRRLFPLADAGLGVIIVASPLLILQLLPYAGAAAARSCRCCAAIATVRLQLKPRWHQDVHDDVVTPHRAMSYAI